MNYLKLVNAFWQADMEHHFTPNDTRLYFYLLHTCNQLGWKMPFGHSDRHLAYSLGVSVNTVRDGKERLQQRGLINFTVPAKKSKSYEGQTRYIINAPTVSKFDTDTDTDVDTVTGTVPDTDTDTVSDTNNKLNKTKPKHKYRGNIKLTEEENERLVAEFGQVFTDACYDHLSSYKKEKGYTSKDDNLTIRRWVVDAVRKKMPATPVVPLQRPYIGRTASDPSLNEW
jgi:hypothetical protein